MAHRESSGTETLISYERGLELIDESEVVRVTDANYAMVYRLHHPALGQIIVVNSSSCESVLFEGV